MEFALVLRELWTHKRALAVGLAIAVVAALLSTYRVQGLGLVAKPLQYSAASTQVFIDSPSTVLGNVNPAVTELTTVATVDANFMTSPALLDVIAKKVGLSGNQLEATGPVSSLPRAMVEPTALQRNVELTGETAPYRLDYSNNPNLPIIGVDTQAPTTKMAVALANAAAAGLAEYVAKLQDTAKVPPRQRIVVRVLGQPTGSVVNAGVGKQLAAIVFVGVMFVWCTLILVAGRFRKSWQESGHLHAARQAKAAGRAPHRGSDVESPTAVVAPSHGHEPQDVESPTAVVAPSNGHEPQDVESPTAVVAPSNGHEPQDGAEPTRRRPLRLARKTQFVRAHDD